MAGPTERSLALGLLGGHVAWRTDRRAAQGELRSTFQTPGQAKVGDLRRAVGGEQDVGRLQIAVNDPALVRHLHGFSQRDQQHGGLADRLGVPPSCSARVPPSTNSSVK